MLKSRNADPQIVLKENESDRGQESPKPKKKISKREARSSIARFQRFMGIVFLVSIFAGIYLLSTDPFLWLVAVSHAYGLVLIVAVDVVMGILSFAAIKQGYLAGMVWAGLTMALQLGDILTGPQFKMTIPTLLPISRDCGRGTSFCFPR